MISSRRIKTLIAHGKRVSTRSEYQFKLGAIIFRGNKVISTGFNKNKTHPTARKYFQFGSIHAEIDAIVHAIENVKGASILVCRTLKNGNPAIAKPCAMCVQVMREFGIKEVFWTIQNIPFWDYSLIKDLYNLIDKKVAYVNNDY